MAELLARRWGIGWRRRVSIPAWLIAKSYRPGLGVPKPDAESPIDARNSPVESTATDSTSAQEGLSGPYMWYVVFLLCVVNAFAYMDRMALAVLAPLIKADMQLSDAQVGLLTGFSFALFFAVCGIPIARWADRGVRRNIIAAALAMWSAITALSGAAQTYWHLLVASVGVGAGEAGCFPPQASLICDYVPMRRRSSIFAITGLGLYGGTMLGMVLAGWLGEDIGWRWTLVVLGVPGLLVAVLIRSTLHEPPRGRFESAQVGRVGESFPEVVRFLWQCQTYRWIILFLISNGFAQGGLLQWWPSFYTRVFGLSLPVAGVYLGIIIGTSSAIGLLAGGAIANMLAKRHIQLPLKFSAILTALGLPIALAALFVPSPWVSMSMVWIASLLWTAPSGPAAAANTGVATARMRATAAAITILLASVLGTGLSPVCIGVLSDTLTPAMGKDALRYALIMPLCLVPVMSFALYSASKTLLADLKAAGAHLELPAPDASVVSPSLCGGCSSQPLS